MRLKIGWVLISVVLFVAAFSLPAHVRLGQESEEAAWLKSGDPCWPTKQKKAFIKMDMSYMTCIPISINLTWDVEETFQRTGRFGTDRVNLKLNEAFTAYLELTHNQKNRKLLDSYEIGGPAPCCPGKTSISLETINATFLVCQGPYRTGCRPSSTSRPNDFVVTPDPNPSVHIHWTRDGVGDAGELISSHLNPREDLVSEPLNIAGDVFDQCSSGFPVKLNRSDMPTWEELQAGLESGVLEKEYPFQDRTSYPGTNYAHAVKGKVRFTILTKLEMEKWQVNVEGWETDNLRPPIKYKEANKKETELPISVTFDWKLQATFDLAKSKSSRIFRKGSIAQASLTPKILMDRPDLCTCSTTSCPGKTSLPDASKLAGSPFTSAEIKDNSIQLTWPEFSSETCVSCVPRRASTKLFYKHEFGDKNFMYWLSRELLPLKDGAVVTGQVPIWMGFKITLKKIK